MSAVEGVTVSPIGPNGEMRQLWEMEAEIIEYAMRHYRGNATEVARRLKIGRSTLSRKLARYADLKRRSPSSDTAPDVQYQSAA